MGNREERSRHRAALNMTTLYDMAKRPSYFLLRITYPCSAHPLSQRLPDRSVLRIVSTSPSPSDSAHRTTSALPSVRVKRPVTQFIRPHHVSGSSIRSPAIYRSRQVGEAAYCRWRVSSPQQQQQISEAYGMHRRNMYLCDWP